MKDPIISVLLPVFNSDRYIAECIDSIINQTISDFEILVIDDCSTDKTVNIISSYSDSRIKLIRKEVNTGYTDSLNWGLKNAKGEFIARMDADDICLPTRFEKQLTFLKKNSDVILCGTQFRQIGDNIISKLATNHDEIKVRLIEGSCIAHPTVMFRKKYFIDNNILYNRQMEPAEDYDLWSRLVFMGKLANLPEVLLLYRIHPDQISISKQNKQVELADFIRENFLQNLTIENNFKYTKNPKNEYELRQNKLYLDKLKDTNIKKKVFHVQYFEEFILRRKLEMILNFNSNQKLIFSKIRIFMPKGNLNLMRWLGIKTIIILTRIYLLRLIKNSAKTASLKN